VREHLPPAGLADQATFLPHGRDRVLFAMVKRPRHRGVACSANLWLGACPAMKTAARAAVARAGSDPRRDGSAPRTPKVRHRAHSGMNRPPLTSRTMPVM